MDKNSLPSDLVPLPTAPWDERPAALPLDIEECRTALWLANGNISEAAGVLKVDPSRLRRFVNKSARLIDVMNEASEQLVDKAVRNIAEALDDADDPARRDSMSKFVASTLGKGRGFNTSMTVVNASKLPTGPLQFTWADGSDMKGDVIEGEIIADE